MSLYLQQHLRQDPVVMLHATHCLLAQQVHFYSCTPVYQAGKVCA